MGQIASVVRLMIKQFVLAYRHLLEVLLDVVQNAQSVQSVLKAWLVLIKNVKILASVFVVLMLNVK